jgi:tetratricopeptide (TPR) repeat protein
MLHAIGENSFGQIRLRQGHAAEAHALLESAQKTLLDLKSAGYADPGLKDEIETSEERLARTRVALGDLDGALNAFTELLKGTEACNEQGAPSASCRILAYRSAWVGDVYTALDRPNLDEPEKAVPQYEQAIRIQQRFVAADDHDRQARFDLAGRYGKLGDAVWKAEPLRALDLYQRALATAKTLASPEQLAILQDSYDIAVSRPLIKLGRSAQARKPLAEAVERGKTDSKSPYPDRVDEITVRTIWGYLLAREGKQEEARRYINDVISNAEALRSDHPDDLTLIYFLSDAYRLLATISTGPERRDAFLHSASAWHSWPATSFTKREEEKDLKAAGN